LLACREQNVEPPTGEPVRPPRSAQWLTPEAGVAPPPRAAAKQLFADDVASDQLALSISIETLGGVATRIIPRGTKLPATHTEVFSTAADNQSSVEVHVLAGERPLATDNRSLGKFQLFGIPPASRGVPQIEVTFLVDAQGVLTVSAHDKATGGSKEVRITGAAGATLDKVMVDRMLAEANVARDDDKIRSEWSQARNELEQLIYSSKHLLGAAGTKLSKKTRTKVEREIAAADSMLRLSTKPENPALLRAVDSSLRKTVHAASEELYKAP
jgi:molecular chaperone DnaK